MVIILTNFNSFIYSSTLPPLPPLPPLPLQARVTVDDIRCAGYSSSTTATSLRKILQQRAYLRDEADGGGSGDSGGDRCDKSGRNLSNSSYNSNTNTSNDNDYYDIGVDDDDHSDDETWLDPNNRHTTTTIDSDVIQYLWTGGWTLKELINECKGGSSSDGGSGGSGRQCIDPSNILETSGGGFAYLHSVDKASLTTTNTTTMKNDTNNNNTTTGTTTTIITDSSPNRIKRYSINNTQKPWDKPDPYCRTPLWWATLQGHSIIAAVLLARGANPNPR